jgi:hypothetical protein
MESLVALNIVSIKDNRRRYAMDADDKLCNTLQTLLTGIYFLASRLLSSLFSYSINTCQVNVSESIQPVKNAILTRNSVFISCFELNKGWYGRAGPSVLNTKEWFYPHYPVPG